MTQTLPPVPAPLQSAPAAPVLPLQVSRSQRNRPQPAAGHPYRRTALTLLLNAAATLHFVWFYLALVRCYLNLDSYEAGTANTPYQYRLLLMLPLRWAHGSAACQSLAAALTSMRPWFPLGVRPESIVEFPLDVVSVILAGLVARQIYKSASPTSLLTPLVYPLTLLMVAATYAFGTMHRLRFLYDLPSLGFFAAGLYLLYFRKPRWQFALLFCIATLNRETTLFLLALFVLTRWLDTRSTTTRDHGTHNAVTSPPHTPAWRIPRLPLADVALTAFSSAPGSSGTSGSRTISQPIQPSPGAASALTSGSWRCPPPGCNCSAASPFADQFCWSTVVACTIPLFASGCGSFPSGSSACCTTDSSSKPASSASSFRSSPAALPSSRSNYFSTGSTRRGSTLVA